MTSYNIGLNLDYAEVQTTNTLNSLGQALVTLSKENAERLLLSATEETRSRRGEATAILKRLQELNPTVAAQFQPKQDALSSLTLRMIRPTDLSPDKIDVPSYLIVSYCWHYPEWPLARAAKPIAPGWEISKPMVDAIMDLRQSPDEGVWLDKLCINQGDEGEKRVHIGAMDIIYKSARRMVILLEDVQLTKEETAAGLAYAEFYQALCDEVKNRNLEGQEKSDFIHQYFPTRERNHVASGKGDDIAAIKAFAMNILDSRWYSRAWCAHESRVAPHQKTNNPLFLCFAGDGRVVSFEFRFIFYLSIYLDEKYPDPTNRTLAYIETVNDPNPTTLTQFRYRIQRLFSSREVNGSAMQHVVNILRFGCFMKGDLMSIALNTLGTPLYFSGNVTTTEDVVWIFSLLVLASDDLVPLIADGSKLRVTDPDAPGGQIVSWVPMVDQGVVDDRLPQRTPGAITAVTREYIELDLLVFKALPAKPTPESLELATRIISDNKLDELGRELSENTDDAVKRTRGMMTEAAKQVTANRPGPMAVFHQTWLTYALDSGLDWMLRFPDVMNKDTNTETWNHGPMGLTSDIKFTSAAEQILKHFYQSRPDSHDNLPAHYLPTIIRSLTCLFDPRLPFFTISPRVLPTGNTDFAFTASTSNKSYVAIPSAIAHLPAHYKRAWIIEPFDPSAEPEKPEDHLPDFNMKFSPTLTAEEVFPLLPSDYADRREPRDDERGTWRLRRRQDIFGFQGWGIPIQEGEFGEGGDVVLLRKQRVYGAEDYDWKGIGAAMVKIEELSQATGAAAAAAEA